MRCALLLLLVPLVLACPASAQDPANPVGLGFAFAIGADGRTVITAVAPGGAAEAAGLQAGDVLLRIDDTTLDSDFALVFLALTEARTKPPPIPALVERDGTTLTLGLDTAPYNVDALLRAEAAFLCQSGDCWAGEGAWQHPNGTRYAGTFRNGRRHGQGIYTTAEGAVYEGGHVNGGFSGKGTYHWPDGWSWRGIWRQNQGTRGAYYAPDSTLHRVAEFDAEYVRDTP